MMSKDDESKKDVSGSFVPKRPRLSARVGKALETVKAAFAPGVDPKDAAMAVLRKGARRADIHIVTGWSALQVERFLGKVAVEDPSFFITGDRDSEDAIFKIKSSH